MMNNGPRFEWNARRSFGLVVVAILTLIATATSNADSPAEPARFASPAEAVDTLKKAATAEDREALRAIFGSAIADVASGDEVQDAEDLKAFTKRLVEATKLVDGPDGKLVLHIGVESHPFAIPLVKEGGTWFFDTLAGKEEILNRRIGENELNAISVCRGYVVAQLEYFLQDHDGDKVMEYAQLVDSSQGKRDGLYWETSDEEPLSPLGALVAQARATSQTKESSTATDERRPYRGYIFKILDRQSPHAPGGEHAYTINGNMVSGFALVAYPAQWNSSGIMSFQINSHGAVYEKNLGENTAELAGAMNAFDPDSTWRMVAD